MASPYKEKITLLIIFLLLVSIIPFCMVSSSRNTLVQEHIHELIVANQENNLSLEQVFKLQSEDHVDKSIIKKTNIFDDKIIKEVSLQDIQQ
ncbi:membrane or secreted protein [Candidatus Magnetomorum sp. HK-1]|nr:membrane or secreted protein [Candidatus Magnetomorum sp. HK-1]